MKKNPASKTLISQAAEVIANHRRILIVSHLKPDGDAFGSALALQWILRDAGFAADALLPSELPLKYREFADGYRRSISAAGLVKDYDLVIICDTARNELIASGKMDCRKLWQLPVLNIDHHPDNSIQGTWNCVLPETAATAEAMWLVVRKLKLRISPKAATLLLIGLSTDTGGFRFSNTDAEAFTAASAFLAAGADLEAVNSRVFFSKPLNQQRLESELILSHTHLDFEGKLAWAVVTPELLAKYDFDMRDGEGVIERLREIEGVIIAALFYRRDGGIKVSLRSQDHRCPVGPVARNNGGGGHELAAGIFLPGVSGDQAAAVIIPQLEKLLEKHF